MSKEHFKNLLRTPHPPKVTDKSIAKIIDTLLDIKLEQFTEELDVELKKKKKIKNRRAVGLRRNIHPHNMEDKGI